MGVKALEKKGHEIVQIEFPYFEELVLTFTKILSAKGKFREVLEIV